MPNQIAAIGDILKRVDDKSALILGNLLISGVYFQNPAYRLIRVFTILGNKLGNNRA